MFSSWICIKNWQDLTHHLKSSRGSSILIPSLVLDQSGAPLIKLWQDKVENSSLSAFVVECTERGQALKCLYHGIKKILFRGELSDFEVLHSIAQKMNAEVTRSRD